MPARITLPFGTLSSRQIIKERDSDEFIVWKFADGTTRTIANEVVLTVDGPTRFDLKDASGKSYVGVEKEGPGQIVRLCLSNDMQKVPLDFNRGIDELDHLQHLDVITPLLGDTFVAPEVVGSQRTGTRVCNQVVDNYDDSTS